MRAVAGLQPGLRNKKARRLPGFFMTYRRGSFRLHADGAIDADGL
ncbi:MAG: hypothetical protein K0R03_2698, partial [Moraxellaceae bacterium]|nr:hypothetical protein [Moraxellaceae bacterium]